MFSSLLRLILSLSISYPYLIKFHEFADKQPQGDDTSNEGCKKLGLIMVSHMSRTLGFCQPLPLTSPKVLFDPAWRHFRWKQPRLGALPTLVLSLTLKKRCQGAQPSCLYTRSERRRWAGGFGFLLFPSTSHYNGQILIEL